MVAVRRHSSAAATADFSIRIFEAREQQLKQKEEQLLQLGNSVYIGRPADPASEAARSRRTFAPAP